MASRLCTAFGKEIMSSGRKNSVYLFLKRFCSSKVTELFPQRLVLPDHGYTPTLSPSQLTSLLTINETMIENKRPGTHVIKGFESNQLGSNFPCEDRRSQAQLVQTQGTLYGVFDGHGGIACAQAVSERLFDYIAVSLLPPEKLEEYSHAMKTDSPMDLLLWHQNSNDYSSDEMSTMYRRSLQEYIIERLSTIGIEDIDPQERIAESLKMSFLRFDNDVSEKALPVNGVINHEALEVALSGSCVIVAHIDDEHIHVANMGDCRAVLGQMNENGDWIAKVLSTDHNTSNPAEVERVHNAHPISESTSVMRNNRLLGTLIPLRAVGDFRYKWTLKELQNIVDIWNNAYAQSIIPMNYYTPPYLCNIPEIVRHKLCEKDKFLVLASDGLWDMLDNQQVVQLVGEYIEGKQTNEHFTLWDDKPVSLGKLNKHLKKRQAGLANKSLDTNAATHLIRHALGDEHPKVSEMITLPPEVVRYYRDDITVTVIFFDSMYIRNHSDK